MKTIFVKLPAAAFCVAAAVAMGLGTAFGEISSLEVGPREVIANSTAIGDAQTQLGETHYSNWPDAPWSLAYDGTAYVSFAGGYDWPQDWNAGIVKAVGTLDDPIAFSYTAPIYIGGYYVEVTDTVLGVTDRRYTGMKPPTDSVEYTAPIEYPTRGGGGPSYIESSGELLHWYGTAQDQKVQSYNGYIGMAKSTDGGDTWTDLGEIARPPISYDIFDTLYNNAGEPGNVVIDPTGSTYFYLYTYERTAEETGATESNGLIVARAPISEVIGAASSGLTATWWKYYNNVWTSQTADGGYSQELSPDNGTAGRYNGNWNTILRNQYLDKYTLFGLRGVDRQSVVYSESTSGLAWTPYRTLWASDFDGSTYLTAVGIEPGIPNGPSFADNGECYLMYQADNSGDYDYQVLNAYSYLSRRKIYVLDNFGIDTAGHLPSEPGWESAVGTVDVEAGPTTSANYPNALQITDNSSTGISSIEKVYRVNGADTTGVAGMEVHAEVYAKSTFGTDLIDVELYNGSTSVFKVAIIYPGAPAAGSYTDYTLQWFNLNGMGDGTWNLITKLPNFTLNSWHLIDVNATTTSFATVSLDHVVYGTFPAWNTAPSLDRVLFGSGSTAGTGGNFYVDDVFLYPSQPTDTFENNTTSPAMLPNGYSQFAGGTNATTLVSTAQAFTGGYSNPEGPGSQSMEISDNTVSYYAGAARTVDPTASKWVEAQVYPEEFGTNGCAFDVDLYSVTTGGDTRVFTVVLDPPNDSTRNGYSDYTLQYTENGTAWNLVAHLGTSGILDTWHQIDIDATSTTSGTAYFEIAPGNMTSGAIANWQAAPTINTVVFNSGKTAGTGFDAYVDNVYISPYLLNDNNFEFDPPGSVAAPTIPWGYTVVAGTAPTISTAEAYDGPNSFYVGDASVPAQVEKIFAAQVGEPATVGGGAVDFQVYPILSPGGAIYVDLDYGQPDPTNTTTVVRLGILYDTNSSGTLEYYGGSSWTALGTAGAVAQNTWNEISINDGYSNVTTGTSPVSVSLNGAVEANYSTSAITTLNPKPSIDRVVFSCKTTGDSFYLDDVLTN